MTGRLPDWIERLLGVETGPGEGTVWSLDHSWPWPPWATLLLAAFAVALVVAVYLREGRRSGTAFRMALACVRLALVAILFFMIAQCALVLQRTGLPYAVVVVDDSGSMGTPDPYEEKQARALRERLRGAGLEDAALTRLGLAKMLLLEDGAALVSAVSRNYKLRVYYLEDAPAGARASGATDLAALAEEIKALTPDGQSTRLGSAVRTVLAELRGTDPAAVILLTDGINTEGPPLAEAAALARRRGVPLFAVGLGDERPVRNLKLSDLLVEEAVFVGDVVHFEFKLTAAGFEGRRAAVTLREEDKPEVLARLEVTLGPDAAPQQVRLPYRPPREGEFRYVVEAGPLEGELKTDDNCQAATLHVRKEQIRVLLAQGRPDYEFRYLANMLQRDKTIRLHTVLQEADPEHAEQDPAALRVFPVRREELFAYDVVILGDVNPAALGPSVLEDLAEFVDQPGKGGALVLIAGPRRLMPSAFRGTPLERLFPFELGSVRYPEADEALTDGFVVAPTELGLVSPPLQLGDTPAETRAIWQKLPPLYWMIETPDLKPGARVLAEHPTRTTAAGRKLPVIAVQYVGAGKVVFHATDETWRWRWRAGDVFFARYWVQTIRFLARSKLAEGGRSAELSSDRREYRRGEPVRLRAVFADERLAPPDDDGVTVVVEHRGGKTERVKLLRTAAGRGVFEGVVPAPAVGAYHAWIAAPALEGKAPAADFTVEPQPGEMERLQMDGAELRRAAQETKGRFYTIETAAGLLDDLPEGRQVPFETLPPKPLWNRWPVLALFLALLVAEWLLRKWGGMV